jgi:murein DD-endopeptidase MepM/ murein hydrolase activator NlpD
MPTTSTSLPTHRRALVAVTIALIASVASPAGAGVAVCLLPPVEAPIARPFSAPACRWCAGHRGITYAVGVGTPVRAAAAGTVTFSGIVVGVRYVVVRHADGLLATYGGLSSSPLHIGDRVASGTIVGRSGGELYFGLRTGPDTYIDPQPLLGELVVPPYLVPTDGTLRRPPPEPVLRCQPV